VSDDLPADSGKQLIKVLEQRGWYVKRVKGSHHAPGIPPLPTPSWCPSTATVPSRRATLSNILTTAGASRDQLRDLL